MDHGIKFDSLIDNLSTCVLLVDKNIHILFANQAAEALFEHSRNQLTGHSLTEFLVGDCIKIERFRNAFNQKENFADTEIQLIFKDGRHCLASLIVSQYESDPQPILSVEINPIDQLKKINKENHQWAVQQASRDLIRGLAHEIKNPLGGIRGAAQ
jgi:two-component system nitrogen regulation sensor histidine kinase GlnL